MPGIDLGLGIAGAAGGASDAFQAILMRRMEEELKRRALDIQQQQANQQGQQINQQGQQISQQGKYWEETAASMRAQREAQAAQNEQTMIGARAKLMTPGQDVTPEMGLPSYLTQQQPAQPASMPGEGPLTAPGQGPMTAQPARTTFRGTPEQQQGVQQQGYIRTILADPNISDNIKAFVRTRQADPTGAIPASLFEDPSAKLDQSFEQHQRERLFDNANQPPRPPVDRTVSDTARMDRSYQYSRSSLDSIAKPMEESAARMGRLIATVNETTPQADALVAPELLTVMAGGMGSGLRMNEAEIARIVGGRSNVESLKAALNKWQLDPSKALSITPVQRAQVRSLIQIVHDKVMRKMEVLNRAGDALVDAPDPNTHRRIVAQARQALQQMDIGEDVPARTSGGGATILSITPIP